MVYGNVAVIGGCYFLITGWFSYLHFRDGMLDDLPSNFFQMNRELFSEVFREPLLIPFLVLPGTVIGLAWYVIARIIEGRRLKEAADSAREGSTWLTGQLPFRKR